MARARKRHSKARRLARYAGAGDVRGYGALAAPRSPFVVALGISGALALLYFMLKGSKMGSGASGLLGEAFDWAKTQAFAAALPSDVARWAPQILKAAKTYDVDPWVLAGIMYRESLGGSALTPKNDPGGTGDFTPRWSGNLYFKFANPATGLPPDGKGWGRGLMQIDYGVHNAWIVSHNWADPQVSLNKAAEIFKANLDYFAKQPSTPTVSIECWRIDRGMPQINIAPWRTKYPATYFPPCASGAKYATPAGRDVRPLRGPALYEAAIAAYNAGTSGVLQALALGLPAEAVTSGQEYVSYFSARIAAWSKNF